MKFVLAHHGRVAVLLALLLAWQAVAATDTELKATDQAADKPPAAGQKLHNNLAESPQECHFGGAFTQQRYLSGVLEPLTSDGSFLYDCELGVIWAAQQPEADILVLRAAITGKGRSQAYRIVGDETQRLKGRHSKFLTQLIMSLMQGDQLALETQFEVTSNITAKGSDLTLMPKKRSLKRAIKRIDVSKIEHLGATPSMRISIIDRNSQRTVITAERGTTVPAWSRQTCQERPLPVLACELLFPV